jgi:hypothetical protein
MNSSITQENYCIFTHFFAWWIGLGYVENNKSNQANLRKHQITYEHHLKASLQLLSGYNDQIKEIWGPRLLSPTFVGPRFKFIINFNSLNIHSVYKITPYIHKKKEAPNLSATNGRCMKPKLKGSCSMATLFNGTTFGNTIELLIVL